VLVGDRIDNGHWSGEGKFKFSPGVGAGVSSFHRVHAAGQAQRAGDDRYHRLVAIVTDSHLDLVGEVDPFNALQEAVYEVLPGLLTVGDDIDAGVFLFLDRQQRGVAFGVIQLGAALAPFGP
jgi:hypothetical protein